MLVYQTHHWMLVSGYLGIRVYMYPPTQCLLNSPFASHEEETGRQPARGLSSNGTSGSSSAVYPAPAVPTTKSIIICRQQRLYNQLNTFNKHLYYQQKTPTSVLFLLTKHLIGRRGLHTCIRHQSRCLSGGLLRSVISPIARVTSAKSSLGIFTTMSSTLPTSIFTIMSATSSGHQGFNRMVHNVGKARIAEGTMVFSNLL